MALNRYRLNHLAKQGHRGARTARRLLRTPDRLIGMILLGNNLVNILAASIATVIGLRLFGANGVAIASMVLTVVILIFAEVAPKTIAALHPEKVAFPAAMVLNLLLKIFYPIVWCVNGLTNLILKPFGIKTDVEGMEALNHEEMRSLMQQGHEISNDHQRMLINILDLELAIVDDVMIPRQNIVGIDLDDDWDDILQQLTQTVYTRLPVYRESIDNIVGLLHIRTVIAKLSHGALTFEDLRQSVRTPYFIPEGTPLTRQLLEFQTRERRMGLIVDEYGDIQGLVTLDDILEEIVGEYTSEGRERTRTIRRLDDGNYLVDGSTTVRMLNRRFDWELPEEEANTLNGLVLEELEEIPDGKASLRIGGHVMTIIEMSDNHVSKVLIKPDRASG